MLAVIGPLIVSTKILTNRYPISFRSGNTIPVALHTAMHIREGPPRYRALHPEGCKSWTLSLGTVDKIIPSCNECTFELLYPTASTSVPCNLIPASPFAQAGA